MHHSAHRFGTTTTKPAWAGEPADRLDRLSGIGRIAFLLPAAGGSVYFVNPHLHTPYTYQYNLSIQQEVARNLVFELNYVGSSSKGLTSITDANPFDLSTVTGPNPARILNEQQTNPNIIGYCANQGGPSDCPFANAYQFGNVSFANFSSMEASLTKQNGNNRII